MVNTILSDFPPAQERPLLLRSAVIPASNEEGYASSTIDRLQFK